MADGANIARQETPFEKGIRHLNKRIQASSHVLMGLAVGIVLPMCVENSNKEQQTMHPPTMFSAFLTGLSALYLRVLVAEFLAPTPGQLRYASIKAFVHACALLLVSLSFSLSLMMRMNVVATSFTLTAAAAFVLRRLWRCVTTKLRTDVEAYMGFEEQLDQLLQLSTSVASMLIGGWFVIAFFYFQSFPEEARDARFLPSEYLTFFTSVAGSLLLLKAVPRTPSPPSPRLLWEFMRLICWFVLGVVVTALAIAASKVRGYAALALVPEGVAFAAWCAQRARDRWALPVILPAWLREYGHDGGAHGEPSSHGVVIASLMLLLAMLTYCAKDVKRALSTLYDEAFVLLTVAAAVAALGWRLVTQPPMSIAAPEVQAAAKILSFSTFCLLALSVLSFVGVVLGW